MTVTTANTMLHLRRLSVETGCRLTGTPGNRAAADYIAGVLGSLGMQVDLQEIACPDWSAVETRLECAGEVLEAYANTFSPSCAVTAPLLPVASLAELEAADITGRISVFYGDLSANPLWTKAFFFTGDRDRRIIQILEERRPAAVITVNPSPGCRYRIIEDNDLDLPSVTVPAEVGQRLLDQPGQPVHLRVDTVRAEGSTPHVIGRLPGDRPGRIVLCAHFDTKEDTPGAFDNASGTAVLLALAETLSQHPRSRWPALEFAAFTQEEYYTSPDRDPYYLTNRGQFREMIAAINIDAVGHVLSSSTLAVFAASPELETLIGEVQARYPAVVRVDPWPASSHFLFFSNGVPSLALSAVGPREIIHTPRDTAVWISPAKLAEAAALVAEFVERLSDKDVSWTRPAP